MPNLLGLPRPNFTPLLFRLTLCCRRRRVLDLDQWSVRPARYCEPSRFETMPSQPSAQACPSSEAIEIMEDNRGTRAEHFSPIER